VCVCERERMSECVLCVRGVCGVVCVRCVRGVCGVVCVCVCVLCVCVCVCVVYQAEPVRRFTFGPFQTQGRWAKCRGCV